MSLCIEEITMPQFCEGLTKTRTVILPYGSVEEHGSHLPLSTDTLHIYDVAKAVSVKRPVFVAPPIHYGLCRSTAKHPGTITITGDTLRRLTIDVVTSMYKQGLRHFILVSGHAGGTHMAYITDAGEELLLTCPESKIAVLSVFDLIAQAASEIVATPGDSHAGEVETSLVLHLRPAWVKGTDYADSPSFPKPFLVRNKTKYWQSGVWGDPSKAGERKGRQLFESAVAELTAVVDRIEHFEE